MSMYGKTHYNVVISLQLKLINFLKKERKSPCLNPGYSGVVHRPAALAFLGAPEKGWTSDLNRIPGDVSAPYLEALLDGVHASATLQDSLPNDQISLFTSFHCSHSQSHQLKLFLTPKLHHLKYPQPSFPSRPPPPPPTFPPLQVYCLSPSTEEEVHVDSTDIVLDLLCHLPEYSLGHRNLKRYVINEWMTFLIKRWSVCQPHL